MKWRYDTVNNRVQSVIPWQSRRLSPGMTTNAQNLPYRTDAESNNEFYHTFKSLNYSKRISLYRKKKHILICTNFFFSGGKNDPKNSKLLKIIPIHLKQILKILFKKKWLTFQDSSKIEKINVQTEKWIGLHTLRVRYA